MVEPLSMQIGRVIYNSLTCGKKNMVPVEKQKQKSGRCGPANFFWDPWIFSNFSTKNRPLGSPNFLPFLHGPSEDVFLDPSTLTRSQHSATRITTGEGTARPFEA